MRYDHRFVTKSLGTRSIFKLSSAENKTIIKYTKEFFIFVFTNSIILMYASMLFQNFSEVFLWKEQENLSKNFLFWHIK